MPLQWMIADISIVLALISIITVAVAALFFDFVKRTGRNHSAESAVAFFDDPNSLKQVACPSISDPAEKYISLIIPAFNEEHRLPGALDETMNYLQQRAAADRSFSYEVLIVDDGSADRTPKVAFDFVRKYTVDNVRVILLGRNHGKGEAIRKICRIAEKELKLRVAAPSDSSPRIPEIAVAAFGSRAHLEKQALATRKWYRNILMKGFHLVVLLTAGPGIRDTQCGFKMFTRAAARELFTNIRLKRWCFDVELVYLCKHLNIPMVEVSVNWSEIPGSKVRLTSIIHMLFELLLIRVGYGLGMWKIHT
ncbi:uncharacterized protein LOC131252918 isoform X2 [Magnolia sinica]|uniref:uncharacterized protein LOC131252918 isoform X2 n=1 Tax=Magnolia sinica TaxID=86752 RepID=UPI002659EADD|nr:uncharacterized protein LOC131252918 isoform X2 [Magnolia sinica]